MNKNKKLLLSFGTLLVTTAPVATVISCGDDGDKKGAPITTEQLNKTDVKVVTNWSLDAMSITGYTGDVWSSTGGTKDITGTTGKSVAKGAVSTKGDNLIIVVTKDDSYPDNPVANSVFTYTYTFDLVNGRLIKVDLLQVGYSVGNWGATFDANGKVEDKDATKTFGKFERTREEFVENFIMPGLSNESPIFLTPSELQKAGTALGIKTGSTTP